MLKPFCLGSSCIIIIPSLRISGVLLRKLPRLRSKQECFRFWFSLFFLCISDGNSFIEGCDGRNLSARALSCPPKGRLRIVGISAHRTSDYQAKTITIEQARAPWCFFLLDRAGQDNQVLFPTRQKPIYSR